MFTSEVKEFYARRTLQDRKTGFQATTDSASRRRTGPRPSQQPGNAEPNLTRRHFLATTAAAGGLGLVGVRPAWADVNWKKYAGTTLDVNLVKSPRGELLTKYQKEFEDLTGIKVMSEMTPEQQQRQKAVIELTSGKPSFDVIHLSYHVQKRQFEKGRWLADL